MLRPLLQEPVRATLTLLSVALGVAVVLAIQLAGQAAVGSFHSSLETLAGNFDLEVVAAGGVPEEVVGTLAQFPKTLRISPRMEDFAVLADTGQTLPLIGLDLVSESENTSGAAAQNAGLREILANSRTILQSLLDPGSVWVGESLGKKQGQKIRLLINDQIHEYTVRGIYADSNGNENAIVMDIAAAQTALHRFGRIDRVLVKVPSGENLDTWMTRLRTVLPPGVELRPEGTGTSENRNMLAAFRWNLQLLSYIALVVGAFLIYNTISVSVVRRRPEVGIVRALGASRRAVLWAFVSEAMFFGFAGAALGLPVGRAMATGAVKLMSATVESLYVSSRPGAIELSAGSIVLAIVIGVGAAIASAYSPAREASLVLPVDAMAAGRRDYLERVRKARGLGVALCLTLVAVGASYLPPIESKPIFGYLAALLLVIASSLAIPAATDFLVTRIARALRRILGVEVFLASQALSGALRRTSVLVTALSTAVAMMVSVGIMVGSFRETVRIWMQNRLPADFYLGPAVKPAPDRHPTLSLGLAAEISQLPGVAGVDRLRAYEISYGGMPATLGAVDLSALRAESHSNFFSGRPTADVLSDIRGKNAVLVSEPFANKHHLRAGESLRLALGGQQASFRVADIYYDYGSERGTVLMDRQTMLRYLPDPAPSNLAIYVAPEASADAVKREILRASTGYRVFLESNRDLRSEAMRIFDRTFSITYALEAVAVIVAVMGIAGALLALVIDRRRELAVLRFLGASGGQVRKQILFEAGLLGVLANVSGVLLGFALSLVLIYVINKQSFGWTIQFHWPIAVLVGALTVVYAATVLAGLYPARVAVRLNPIEALHEE